MNRLLILMRTYGGIAFRGVVMVSAAVLDPGTGIAAAIRAAMVACTSGKSVGASITTTDTAVASTGTLSQTVYGSARDKMVLFFSDANGGTHQLGLPGPKVSTVSAAALDVGITATGPLKGLCDLLSEKYCAKGAGALGPVLRAIRRRVEAKS